MSVPPPGQRVRLLMVTGSGRSGTSTVAGTLKRLGLHIPQPEVPADESNPRGFYESQWVVEFHKRLLDSVPARTNDARPQAAREILEAVSGPEARQELSEWLSGQAERVGPGGQLVVKDPRAFWMHELWSTVADDLDLDLSYLTMLRHPAEVVQSRDTHYLSQYTAEFRRTRQTANLAGWVNTAFETERATRGHPRAFVRYVDLLADWRSTMVRAAEQLGVGFNAELRDGEPHAVDDFIDAKLHRARVSWEGIDAPPELQDLAVQSWDALNMLVEAPYDDAAVGALEESRPRYVRLHQYSEAVALDHTNLSAARARREATERLRAAHAERAGELRRRLGERNRRIEELEQRLGQGRAARLRRLLSRWR